MGTAFIIIAAFFFRLVALSQSLWLDEAIGALTVKNLGFREIISRFALGDNHPPLYYLLLKVWTFFFGYSEISLRFPSVLLGVLTVFFLYRLVKLYLIQLDLKEKTVPFWTALFLATSGLHVYYSQEARMYVPAAFWAVFAIYFFLRTLNRPKFGNWIGFSIGVTVLVFTDYLPVFLLPIFPLYAVLAKIKNRKWWRNLIISFLPLVILGFWWLPTFKIQSLGGKWLLAHLPAWRTIAGGATFKQVALLWIKFCFGRISLVNKSLYYLLIIILSLPFGLLLVKALKSFKQFLFVWLWLAVPVVLSFLVSLFFPAFIYFRFIFVLPAFYLILALGAASCRRMKIKYFLIASVILINLATSAFYLFDSDQHRENWRLATVMIERRLKEKEAAIFVNPEPFAPYRWYSQKANSGLGLLPHIGATGDEINKTTKETIVGLDGLYLFNYLKDLNDPDGSVVSALNQSDFYPKEVLGGFGDVGQVIYLTRKK